MLSVLPGWGHSRMGVYILEWVGYPEMGSGILEWLHPGMGVGILECLHILRWIVLRSFQAVPVCRDAVFQRTPAALCIVDTGLYMTCRHMCLAGQSEYVYLSQIHYEIHAEYMYFIM